MTGSGSRDATTTPGGFDRALAAAVICRALARSLRPPDAAMREATGGPSADVLRRAAAIVMEADTAGGVDLTRAVEALTSAPRTDLESTHRTLFGPTLRGKVCPYETEYGSLGVFRQTQELADIAGYYRAFGLYTPPGSVERPDSVVCELEFVEFLHLKEAWAIAHDDAAMLEVTRVALRTFLRDHVGRFGRAFGATLARSDEGGFYGRVGEALEAFVEIECRHVGVPSGPRMLEVREVEDDPTPMACGNPDTPSDPGLLQIAPRSPLNPDPS